MSNAKSVLFTVIAVPLGSCVATTKDTEPAVPLGHNFAYAVPHRENVNLVQAFDDGSTTYLQFNESPSAPIDIRQVLEERSVAYSVDQRFIRVKGVYDRLRITVANQSTTVTNEAAPITPAVSATNIPGVDQPEPSDQARSESMSAVIASESFRVSEPPPALPVPLSAAARRLKVVPVGVPEHLQTMTANLRVAALKQEISTLEEKVRLLSAALEEAQQAGRDMNLYMRYVGGLPRVAMKFADNSFEARLDDRLLDPLGNAVRAANRIYLHGHTDAYVASETGTELAIRRTVEVRRLLISLNVDPERIRLFYRGAGNFVANNSTPEGKALNRRVEIELRKW